MLNMRKKIRVSLLTFIAATVIGFPLMADDTEVYIGGPDFSAAIRPNILFIIDTSGSMDTSVTLTTGTYDPLITYSGDCDASRIYWDSTGNPPDCDTSNWFVATSNVCEDSGAALTTGPGLYVGRMARYRSSRRGDLWGALSRRNHTDLVECQADWGVHGNGNDGTYPANEGQGGPFRSNSTGAINWNNTGTSYTIFSGNYLNWRNSPGTSTTTTRLEIVKEVFSDLVDSTSGVNAGLMRFDNKSQDLNKGGYFVLPMQELNNASRPAFKDAVSALSPGGYTPLAETMYEAARYYRGEGVEFGDDTDPGTNHMDVLDPGNSSRYKTPIEFQCQKNTIVMLTDGEPTYDSNADSLIQALPDLNNIAGDCSFSDDDCLDEVAHYLHDYDQIGLIDDDQIVTSHMIGFHTDQTLLQDAARKGGGSYYTADDTSELTTAFTKIITEILAVNTTFVAPAVPVNAFNRLTHRNELYFSLFRPSLNPQWTGNVKRYQLEGDPAVITDANGNPAVDDATGFFADTATSFWTQAIDAPDGQEVGLGGAASQLTVGRTLYTYTGADTPSNESLTATENLFVESNVMITKAMLGIDSETDAYRTELLQWSRGVDIDDLDEDGSTTDARRQMGDPLHSNPVVINYGGTDANPDITLFTATNEGFLHAINTRDGTELFSFIPQELLPNLDLLYQNSVATSHPYGLDGPLTAWMNDVNNNGVLLTSGGSTETGEHAYLYAGMRRGGKNYYALDVTNRNSPKLKWIIKGGQGDFTELAQTWSRPQLARIKDSGAPRTVLFFGGGYDVNQDTEIAGVDSEGRALYMVDATTGARLGWVGGPASGANLELADMQYSMPATVLLADIDADTLTDIIFAVDVGGQVWRFDIDNSGDDSVITGGVVAKLAGTGPGENRRFYERADVSLLKRSNGQLVYAVGIGSGYRAHPLSTATQERYHMLFFGDVYSPPASYTVLTEDDLLDVTSDLNPNLAGSSGWYINLEVGEKVMARSKTVDGLTLFTTFDPNQGSANSCAPSQGLGRLYAVNTLDAAPLHNLDGVGTLGALTTDDRSLNLMRGGIQPEPTLIFTRDDHPIIVVGTEKVLDIPLYLPLKRTSWEDQ